MSYQVLARKYRPQKFADMIGQDHVVRALVNALDNNTLHHAYLFSGMRGVGKTTVARIFAKSLNCEKGVTSTPCGECSVCRDIEAGRFFDLIEVDAASRTKVEETRELMENVPYAPSSGRYKVYLIDEVHMFSKHSFNALLKTLEEPPAHVKFLLATTDPQALPVTVLSRCLQFNLKRLPQVRLAEYLGGLLDLEKIDFDKEALTHIARASEGSVRDSLSLVEQAAALGERSVRADQVESMLGRMSPERVLDLLETVIAGDGAATMACVETLAEYAPDYKQLLAEMMSVLHHLAMTRAVTGSESSITTLNAERVASLAAGVTAEEVQLYYQIGLHGRRDMPFAADERESFEMTLLRMLAFRPQSHMLPQSAGQSGGHGDASNNPTSSGNSAHQAADSNKPIMADKTSARDQSVVAPAPPAASKQGAESSAGNSDGNTAPQDKVVRGSSPGLSAARAAAAGMSIAEYEAKFNKTQSDSSDAATAVPASADPDPASSASSSSISTPVSHQAPPVQANTRANTQANSQANSQESAHTSTAGVTSTAQAPAQTTPANTSLQQAPSGDASFGEFEHVANGNLALQSASAAQAVNTPDLSVAEPVAAPAAQCDTATLPAVGQPEASQPEASQPEARVPQARVPQARVPQARVPEPGETELLQSEISKPESGKPAQTDADRQDTNDANLASDSPDTEGAVTQSASAPQEQVNTQAPVKAPAQETEPEIDLCQVTWTTANWATIVEQLNLVGIQGQLARNCAFQSLDQQQITLLASEDCEHLVTDRACQHLQSAVAAALQRTIRLSVETGSNGTETPAQIDARLAAERQREAEQSIKSDPVVQTLVEKVDGEIDLASIRPVGA